MKTGTKIGIAVVASLALIFGIVQKNKSDKAKAADDKAKVDAQAKLDAQKATEATINANKTGIALAQAKAAADKAAANLVRANTAANLAEKAAADKAHADAIAADEAARAIADKEAADAKAIADKIATDAATQLKANIDRENAIFIAVETNNKFPSLEDASYFISNLNLLDVNHTISNDRIKAVLRNSNMAFYDGVVSQRLSLADMQMFLDNNAPKVGGKSVISFNGGFDFPILSSYSDYQLKRLLANGYWFAIWNDGNGTDVKYQMSGNAYTLFPYSFSGDNDSHLVMVTIPATYKGGLYASAVSGSSSFSNFSNEISNRPTDLHSYN